MAPELRSIFAEAVGHHQAGRLDAAIASYRRMLALKPDLAGAHHNLGNLLFEQGKLDEAKASYRRAVALQPNLAGAHNNLGTVLLEQDRPGEAVACYREAVRLAPDYAEALNNLGAALCRLDELGEGEACIRRALLLKDDFAAAYDNLAKLLQEQGRPSEAGTAYRQLLRLRPGDGDALNGLASVQAAHGDAQSALETILQSLTIEETPAAKRIFVDVAKRVRWTGDHAQARGLMARALAEPWARPGELTATAAHLVKQNPEIGAAVARAAQAWPRPLSARELFGPGDPGAWAEDTLLLVLLVSAQNTDIALERFLTMARRVLLEAADHGAEDAGLGFYAALARQCFINEYVFFRDKEEFHRARAERDALAAALEKGAPISVLRLLAVAAYFPLHSLSGAGRLMERAWPEPVAALLVEQVREPREEAQLRAAIPKLTLVKDKISRLVQDQYEENPYPRWLRIPPAEKAGTIAGYLRRKFPLAAVQRHCGGKIADFLSAGCGTGQLALQIAQSVPARVLAVDLSLTSLGYAQRKARELGLAQIEFAQADLLELGRIGRSFDVVECSGVLHHMAEPFAGWRALLSLLRPGGFMLVGLYSEAGRRGIAAARRFIAEQGYGTSADGIRRCRQDLLALDRAHALGAAFGDFFGLSTCRDLLFHVQERQTRLSAIAAFLKDNRLTFLGFETDDATLHAYRRRFPDDAPAACLDHWEAFENDNPETFSRMYVFWVQKNGAA